jgi:integrase
MAQVQELPGGKKKIRFYDHSGVRRGIHFGKIPKRLAESHAMHIESLVNAKRGKFQADGEHFQWAGEQNLRIQRALATIGLIPSLVEPEPEPEKPIVPTIGEWFTRYIENRPGSDGSRKVWNRAKSQAEKFFGKERPIDSITSGDAVDFFEAMQRGNLAETTARKMIGVTRQVFKRALKSGHISVNPFHDDELPTSIADREKEYIALPTIQSVLNVLPSAEWRAVIIFARFAGMRVQSELPLLKWSDIDEHENRFAVYSPKTKKTRRVPLFPEIRSALDDLRPITGDSEYVLKSLREKSNNWRSPLEKILIREGIAPWAPLFNCLRASAEIDISRQFGVVAATEWVGNSVQVAMKHYLRTTSDDFERASDRASNLGPKSGPENARNDETGQTVVPNLVPHSSPSDAVKHRKPNKKRGSEQNSDPRSVDDIGLEPTTSTMSTWRSNQLS